MSCVDAFGHHKQHVCCGDWRSWWSLERDMDRKGDDATTFEDIGHCNFQLTWKCFSTRFLVSSHQAFDLVSLLALDFGFLK